ncbi:MAG: PQQ-binding-like beta-propeller repeat protein, partial [Deltaproteobacteria bacterium]|nr:PQQ-binding-like beta-propeller repeat protein [Deltaproteobacteria bacterium]
MRRPILAAGLLTAAVSTPALAKVVMPMDVAPPTFQLAGRPLGGAKPAATTAPYLTSSRIAAVGDGALVIDADSGNLMLTDKTGKAVAQLAIGGNAGLLAYDPVGKLAFVADRAGNRVAVVEVGDALTVKRSLPTPSEPYGVALSPDRTTVMVTTIADRTLVAFDAATGKERWRTALGREPRGLAVSPDGTRALVAYLATGTVDQIDLVETHAAEHVALATQTSHPGAAGASFARGSFSVLFMGEHQAVVPFQRETPVQISDGAERSGSYGGGFDPPVTHQLAFLGFERAGTRQTVAQIAQHQPRAMAWDGAHDALYVAGMGNDTLLQLKNASQMSIAAGPTAMLDTKGACGPDGLAVASDGKVLVWCSFTRSIARVEFGSAAKVEAGPSLVASTLSAKQHDGLVLFHQASKQVSQNGAMACASCHPDGRADGLSWRIDKHELQTPLLDGRLVGTHPFKWDGGDPTLRDSLSSTMKRLGGMGLSPTQTDALASYLEALPAPKAPTRDVAMVSRGKQLFDSAELGCASCHDGKAYTDREKHKLASVTLPEADTPSLIGLAASAPYFHDGSAVTI